MIRTIKKYAFITALLIGTCGLLNAQNTGTKLVFGWSACEGSCDVVLGNPNEILKANIQNQNIAP